MHSAIKGYLTFIREHKGSRYVDTVSFYFYRQYRQLWFLDPLLEFLQVVPPRQQRKLRC